VSRERQPCVYILASRPYGTLYIGVTSNLVARLWQHRENATPGFTSRHGVHRLVRFELLDDLERAISPEKRFKRWHRQWKINPMESENPQWLDLAVGMGLAPVALRPGHDGC